MSQTISKPENGAINVCFRLEHHFKIPQAEWVQEYHYTSHARICPLVLLFLGIDVYLFRCWMFMCYYYPWKCHSAATYLYSSLSSTPPVFLPKEWMCTSPPTANASQSHRPRSKTEKWEFPRLSSRTPSILMTSVVVKGHYPIHVSEAATILVVIRLCITQLQVCAVWM